jgi:probable phosphoglycerate mutase
MTRFGLVRHGQTDYNLNSLFQGSSDIPLNDTGRQQAHHALDSAPPITWDLAFSSPLQRAEETARIIAADHGIAFAGTDPRMAEISWGEAEGKDTREMEARYPGRSFPGRESTADAAARAMASLEDLVAAHPSSSVLVVAHGTWIRLVLTALTGLHLPSIPNAALSLIEVTPAEAGSEGEDWQVTMIGGEEVDLPAVHITTDADGRFEVGDQHLRPQDLPPVAAR